MPSENRDFDDELEFHFEQRVRDYMARGMDETSARKAAHARLGDVERVRRECGTLADAHRRAQRRRRWLDDLRQDVGFGVRAALRAPLFTLMAVVTLALGIGANAAIFGVVKSVLLDALPYDDADRLVRIYARADAAADERQPLSPAVVADLERRQRSFAELAPFHPTTYEVIHRPDAGPRVLSGALVAPGFFETLGVAAILGRTILPSDLEDPFVTLLSHDTWRTEFGADPSIVGRQVHIDADARTVIGVLPPGFAGPMGSADLYFPLNLASSLRDPDAARRAQWLGAVARLRPGVDATMARRDLAAIAADLAREHPATDAGRTLSVVSLRTDLVGDTRTTLLAVMGSALLVLVIACANLSGALLTRTVGRRRELAVRAALGAGRGRIARQLLTESTLIAVAGAGVGLVLARLALHVLGGLALPALPEYVDLSLDAGAVLVMTLVTFATGIVMGVLPALTTRRSRSGATLHGSVRGSGEDRGAGRVRGVLVAGQLALSLALLLGAGLLARSLLAMTVAPLGYEPDGVLTFSVKGPVPATDAERRLFFDGMEERIAALPGVRDVASTNELPGPAPTRVSLDVESRGAAQDELAPVAFATVSDAYFRTLGIRIVRGRAFGPQDGADAPGAIIISEGMANRYWPGEDPIGARLRLGARSADAPWSTVVGVAADVRNDPTRPVAEPMAYGTHRQDPLRSSRTYAVRTVGAPLAMVEAARRELVALDPSVPMDRVATLESQVSAGFRPRTLPAVLLGAFAALALLLSSVGVYALFSSMATARTHEFAVRLALGSSPRAIAFLVVRRGAVWMLAGLGGGIIGAVVIARSLRSLLYGVSALDPVAFAASLGALGACASVALLLPVARAARTEPNAILD